MLKREQLKALRRLKRAGLNKKEVMAELGLSFPTVRKYWDMDLQTFDRTEKTARKKRRKTRAEIYRQDILDLLNEEGTDIRPHQLYRYLYDKYGVEPVVGRKTLANYYHILEKKRRK